VGSHQLGRAGDREAASGGVADDLLSGAGVDQNPAAGREIGRSRAPPTGRLRRGARCEQERERERDEGRAPQ
jgi:hypothetical protein